MNNLSFLRVRYMQNFFIDFMVEIPSISKKENSSFEEKTILEIHSGIKLDIRRT